MNDKIVGVGLSAYLSYYFRKKGDKRLGKLEKENKKLKKDNKEIQERQAEDKKEIRAEIKELLQEVEKRVRLEERLKNANQICSIYEKDANKYYKENEKSENKLWQLKYLLMWHGFKQGKTDEIIDGNILLTE
ncbi:16387_t:CDS:2 [Cetraspora pellucida]|uniref:16387_t:CDS:1 n=1 Tax=Cetraspora pellucida TaxID=1433469 RepID=A0ACA9PHN7_9GLOM|nr:16387_t:CDS:2 [Cetraspora pellucida]